MSCAKQALGVLASLLVMTTASAARADYFPCVGASGGWCRNDAISARLWRDASRSGDLRPARARPGSLSAEIKADGGTQTVNGLASSFGLSFGGVVSEGLVLHGTLGLSSVPGAKVEGAAPITVEQERSFDVTSLGFGMTYYTPDNLWFSAGLAPTSCRSRPLPADVRRRIARKIRRRKTLVSVCVRGSATSGGLATNGPSAWVSKASAQLDRTSRPTA